ncbi:hypothetical protein D3C72_1046070 [compost metagenome]
MPPPSTSMRLGSVPISSAPVESTTRGSFGMKGRLTDCEPAAMMALRNLTVCFLPVVSQLVPEVSSTSRWYGSMKLPTPRSTVTLRILAMAVRPPVSLPTTLFLWPSSLARSTVGAAKLTPRSAKCLTSSMTEATCSSAFDGMQPTFRHTPPSVA